MENCFIMFVTGINTPNTLGTPFCTDSLFQWQVCKAEGDSTETFINHKGKLSPMIYSCSWLNGNTLFCYITLKQFQIHKNRALSHYLYLKRFSRHQIMSDQFVTELSTSKR